MANKIALVAGNVITISNPAKAEVATEELFNTGIASVETGIATVEKEAAFGDKKIASIRLYKNNEYVALNPGDSIVIEPKSVNELAYYLAIENTDICKVEYAAAAAETAEDAGEGEAE